MTLTFWTIVAVLAGVYLAYRWASAAAAAGYRQGHAVGVVAGVTSTGYHIFRYAMETDALPPEDRVKVVNFVTTAFMDGDRANEWLTEHPSTLEQQRWISEQTSR
jgi:hypothetical protein